MENAIILFERWEVVSAKLLDKNRIDFCARKGENNHDLLYYLLFIHRHSQDFKNNAFSTLEERQYLKIKLF